MKKLSDEFVLSVSLLLVSFFILEVAIIPSMRPDKNLSATVSLSNYDRYESTGSRSFPPEYDFPHVLGELPRLKRGAYFDIPVIPFDIAAAHKRVGPGGASASFGPYKDAWGYPVPSKLYKNEAVAKSDPGQSAGSLNCRANTNVTGYFIASFQDVQNATAEGYDDPVLGQARRDEVCSVLEDVASLIRLDQTDITPVIVFTEDSGNMPPNALASASPIYSGGSDFLDAENGFLFDAIVKRHEGMPIHAFVNTNFGPGVAWDVDSSLGPNTYDFYTVMYHEILHALGMNQRVNYYVWQTNIPTIFNGFENGFFKDSGLANKFLDQVSNLTAFPTGAPTSWALSDDAVYRGKKNNPGAAADGIRPVYSPSLWQQGSSMAHFDMNRANGDVYVMHPTIDPNTVRPIHEHEKEVLCHMGYQVLGIPGCELPTPVSRSDAKLLEGQPVCINPLENDESWVGGTLSIHSARIINLEAGDNVVYYSDPDCAGGPLPNANGAESVKLIPGNAAGTRILAYDNKDSVANRISNESHVSFVPCANDPDEHVCNGDFEDDILTHHALFGGTWFGEMVCSGNQFDAGYKIPWWCNEFGSPDVPDVNVPTLSNWFNIPFDCSSWFPGCLVNTPDGSDRLMRVVTPSEASKTRLETPVVAGQQYVFSADVLSVSSIPTSYTVMAGLEHDASISSIFGYGLDPIDEQVIVSQAIPNNDPNNDWTHLEVVFTPNNDYEYLVIYSFDEATMYADNISVKPYVPSEEESVPVDIKVSKELLDPTLSLFDREITWRVRVANLSGNPATNITILDMIPIGFLYESYITQNPQESYDPVTGAYVIPNLPAGGQTQIDIVMKVPQAACGTKINIATLASLGQTDTNPANDQSSVGIKLKLCRAQQVK